MAFAQQPAGAAIGAPHGRIGRRGAGHHRAGEGVGVGCVERRVAQHRGHRQPPAVDQRAREGVALGQLEHRVAEQPAHLALGRDEVGGARRIADVLVGRELAFTRVAVEQCVGCVAGQHGRELPGEVVGVLHARVGAARAEGRHAVRRVAREQHAAVAEALHALAGEGVDAGPADLELHAFEADAVQQRAHARRDALGLAFFHRVGVPAELEVDAPHAVGLLVQQHALAGVERGVEPEAALGGQLRVHRDVGDQEAVAEHAALGFLPQHLAQVGARAVAGGHVAGLQAVLALGRFHGQHRAVVALRDAGDLVVPAQVDQRQGRGAFDEVALDVVLLQVDEGRALVAGLGQQVEAVDLLVMEEHLADVPRHALVHHAVAAAEAVEHLERALGEADRARSAGQAVVVVEQHHGHLPQGEVDGEREAHRAGAHDHHGVAGGRGGVLVGVAGVVEAQALIVDHVLSPCSCRFRRLPRAGEGRGAISLPGPSTCRCRAGPSTRAGRRGPRPRRRRGSRRRACSGRR
ncbi:hypothetical protein D9M68_433630 [compost metagenome]